MSRSQGESQPPTARGLPPRASRAGGAGDALAADLETVAALRAGKPEAFHRFYEAWFPRILAFARSERPDEEDARALCERVFRRILRELPGFSGRVALARFVLGACVLEARDDASEARPPTA